MQRNENRTRSTPRVVSDERREHHARKRTLKRELAGLDVDASIPRPSAYVPKDFGSTMWLDRLRGRRQHAVVGISRMDGDELYTIERHGHDAEELCNVAIASFTRRVWSPSQRRALTALETWIADWQQTSPSLQSVLELIKIFSAIFFLNKLEGVTIAWRRGLWRDKSCFGLTRQEMFDPRVYIELEPRDYHQQTRDKDHCGAVVGTLLHECIHAFLMLYSCEGYCGRQVCREHNDLVLGKSGHGHVWRDLAVAVQSITEQRLGILVNIGFLDDEPNDMSPHLPARQARATLIQKPRTEGAKSHRTRQRPKKARASIHSIHTMQPSTSVCSSVANGHALTQGIKPCYHPRGRT